MAMRYKGRHRRPTRNLPVAAVARPAMAIGAAAAVSLGMAAPAHAHGGEHRVGANDSLSKLAAEHGTSWQTIYADNRAGIGADPNRLGIGQVLTIGGAGSAPSAPSTPSATGPYVVQAGDTLGSIAAVHGTTWQQLHAINRDVIGANPNVLRLGQRLALGGPAAAAPAPAPAAPDRASRGSERVASASVAAPVPVAAATPTLSSTAYSAWAPHVRPVVQEVAERFGVSTVLTRPGHSPTQDLAADFMVYTDTGKGDALAQYVIDNASRFRVDYVIWKQRMYLPSTGAWRAMADRGSPTANHMDHPHVAFLPAG